WFTARRAPARLRPCGRTRGAGGRAGGLRRLARFRGGAGFRQAAPALFLLPGGLALALLVLSAAAAAGVLGRGLLARRAGFAEADGDCLPWIAHLAAAARLQLAMLVLVHHAANDLLLPPALSWHRRSPFAAPARRTREPHARS